jgi:MFS family permease
MPATESVIETTADASNDSARIRAVLPALFLIQFFSWSGLFALWIYSVPVVTRYVFAATSTDTTAYRDGLFWVSLAFAFYAVLGTSLAFALPRFVARWGYARVHAVALLIGGAGIASLSLIRQPMLLLPAFIAIGIGWSSIGNIPYGIVSEMSPPDRISHYMRWFGFSTVIPQTTATFVLAFAVEHWFAEQTNLVMAFGGASMMLAGVVTLIMRQRLEMTSS